MNLRITYLFLDAYLFRYPFLVASAITNLHFLSTAWFIPILLVVTIANELNPSSICNLLSGSVISSPLSNLVILNAWLSLPGPDVKDRWLSFLRKLFIISIPSKGCNALIRTAPASTSLDRAETFTQYWLP